LALPNPREVFRRMIDDLESAASCARQLAFLRQQNDWLVVDELILRTRKQIIALAEGKEKANLQRGLYIP
jgi:hypothetical protein